jgi:hypothetical protein
VDLGSLSKEELGFLSALGAVALQIVVTVYHAGRMKQRFDDLEKAVKNGITTKQDNLAKAFQEQSAQIAKIEERCAGRKDVLDRIQGDIREIRESQ